MDQWFLKPKSSWRGDSMHNIQCILYTIWFINPSVLVIYLIDWCYFFDSLFIPFAVHRPRPTLILFVRLPANVHFLFTLRGKTLQKKQYCINVLIKQNRTHPFMLYFKCPERDRWDSIYIQQSFPFFRPMGSLTKKKIKIIREQRETKKRTVEGQTKLNRPMEKRKKNV